MKPWWLLLMGLSAAHASDLTLEAGAGLTHYTTYGDGIWYQLGEPHKVDTHGNLYLLGITQDVNERWTWHLDYVNFGKAFASCSCTADENYDYRNHQVIDPLYPVKNTQFNGSGNVQGIQFKNTVWLTQGKTMVGADLGLMAYRNRWTETVYHWTSKDWQTPVNGVHETSTKVRFAPVVGLSVRTSNVTFSADAYLMKPQSLYGTPPLWKYVTTMTVTYAF